MKCPEEKSLHFSILRELKLLLVPTLALVGLSLVIFFSTTQAEKQLKEAVFVEMSNMFGYSLTQTITTLTQHSKDLGNVYSAFGSSGFSSTINNKVFDILNKGQPSVGLQATSWIPKVTNVTLSNFIASAREENPNFKYTPSENRTDYYPVMYLYPLVGNEQAVGFDLYSDKNRKIAMEKAIQTGQTTITPRLRLVQETQQQYGVLHIQPVYKHDYRPMENKHIGFINSVIRIGDLVNASMSSFGGLSQLNVFVFDLSANCNESLMHRPSNGFSHVNSYTDVAPLQGLLMKYSFVVADRNWLLICVPTNSFVNRMVLVTSWLPVFASFGVVMLLYIILLRWKQQQLFSAKFKIQQSILLSQTKSLFLAMASHDLRTPLHGILGSLDMLKDEPTMPADHSQTIKEICDLCQALTNILDDIIDITRIEQGQLKVSLQAFDLAYVAHQSIQLFDVKAREKGLTIDCEFMCNDCYCIGDSSRVRQIIHNFLSNAIKFTSEGSIMVKVFLRSGDPSRMVLEVIDSGMGIPNDKLNYLFQPFHKLNNKTNVQGAGLGLAISKQLANLMNGSVGAYPSPNCGTTFWLELPSSPAVNNEGINISNSPSISSFPKTKPILIAEDNSVNQQLIRKMLQSSGFRVDIVENGSLAINKSKGAVYGLILLDLEMPVMDGWTAAQKISSLPHHPPIIAVTANAMESDKERCLSGVFSDYLRKPFTRKDLLEKVNQWYSRCSGLFNEPVSENEAKSLDDVEIPLPPNSSSRSNDKFPPFNYADPTGAPTVVSA